MNAQYKRRFRLGFGGTIAVIALFFLAFAIALFGGSYYLSTLPILVEVTITPTMTIPATVTAISAPAAVASGTVCTDVPEGRLNVRTIAGDGNPEVGYLNEGQAVQINASAKAQTVSDGGQWILLSKPVSGWVNETYICEEK